MTSLPGSGEQVAPRMAAEIRPRPAPVILSFVQARQLLQARREGRDRVVTSLDLGLTESEVDLDAAGATLGGQRVSWQTLKAISENELTCFEVSDHEALPIQRFSDYLNRFYSLMPTLTAPTLLVSGIPMHRIQGTDPHQDTLSKVRTIAPLVGRVLDVCTGLGYTAVQAARTAEQVVTLELDPAVLEVARLNPWSAALFQNPRIVQIVGDACDEVTAFEDAAFSRIIHDPPTFSLAGELYSGAFYRQLFRVLKPSGRLFHYIGDLESRSGRNVAKGVVRRLQDAGFGGIVRKPGAFGLVAYKTVV